MKRAREHTKTKYRQQRSVVMHKGDSYGLPLREGTNSRSPINGMGPIPGDDN